jgi:FMN phosphatase YigB (HAD superfamily)
MPLHAITLDLDDTLWPMAPTLRRAEALMQDWLRQHAPATVAAHDKAAWAALRRSVVADRPDWAHDLSALRRETIRRALLAAGDDPALDVDGALAAGLQAAWVRRPALPDIGTPAGTPHHVVPSLTELADRLGV